MKREISFLISFLFFANLAFAQIKPNPALTADSLATGNYKDVLTSFFQLAFNRFIGDDKEIRFASNPFAVMAKADTSLLMDAKYYKYRHLRDLNFSFAAKLDSSYKFNGFSSGIKYIPIRLTPPIKSDMACVRFLPKRFAMTGRAKANTPATRL